MSWVFLANWSQYSKNISLADLNRSEHMYISKNIAVLLPKLYPTVRLLLDLAGFLTLHFLHSPYSYVCNIFIKRDVTTYSPLTTSHNKFQSKNAIISSSPSFVSYVLSCSPEPSLLTWRLPTRPFRGIWFPDSGLVGAFWGSAVPIGSRERLACLSGGAPSTSKKFARRS